MEYVKKRRLYCAGLMLCETQASVLDIALQVGYESHEGFTRAFKARFGLPPLQYRKRYAVQKSIFYKEERDMGTRTKISHYAGEIVENWEKTVAELEKYQASAMGEIEKNLHVTRGIAVAFGEWQELARRMDIAGKETRQLFSAETDMYEVYDKTEALMKVMDDINFQMNLLRFLTGVELCRMGEHGVPFAPVLQGLTELCKTEGKRKKSAENLVLEINKLIRAEIRQEAVTCLHQAAEVMRGCVQEGMALTEKVNALVIGLGIYGRGFSLVAKECEKATARIREGEQNVLRFLEAGDALVLKEGDAVSAALSQLADSAFAMNLNAFNAAVETARAGEYGEPQCPQCAADIRAYAAALPNGYKTCEKLYSDSVKLLALLRTENNQNTCKINKDIAFQAGFLCTQLTLESERSSREDFLTLARAFEKALATFKSGITHNSPEDIPNAVKIFITALISLIKQGKATAEAAGAHGAAIKYIVEEFESVFEYANGQVYKGSIG
jgi:hypothetical protein